MDNVTLSQRFASIGIVDDNELESDSDLIAMRKKYFPLRNRSVFSLYCNRTFSLTPDVNKVHEELEMDSDWKIHYKKLKQKCESLVSGVCFSIHKEACIDDDFVLTNGNRSDHEYVDDTVGNRLEGKESLQNETSVGDINLSKNVHEAFSGNDRSCRDFRESDNIATCDLRQRENARKETEDEFAFGAGISPEADIETASGTQTVNRKVTSLSGDKNTGNLRSMNVSNKEDSNRNKATKTKIATKRKDPKVVRKFDIKPASSFPLDELLPIVEKSPKKICGADETKVDKTLPEKIDANSDSYPHQESNVTETEVFYGSIFDYSYSNENKVDDAEPVINTNSINTGLSYIKTGIIPDCSDVLNHTMTETVKSQLHDCNGDDECPETNKYAELESPLHTSTFRSNNHFNMSTVSSDTLNVSSMDFCNDRKSEIQSTIDEIGECHSMEQCENLLMILNDQCSVLATNDKDRLKLQSMINALRSKVIDACLAVPSVPTELTPSEYRQDNIVGPGGDSLKLAKNNDELFEGRTLLKGGVEPRHIPKTSIDKKHKNRPVDPRPSHSDNGRRHLTLPLPKFAVNFYREKTVKRMTHLDLDIYSANKHKRLEVKDPKMLGNTNHSTSDVEMNSVNEVSSAAVDSMKCALDTGNIKISVQQSFLDSNSSLNFGKESNLMSKLSGINALTKFCNPSKITSSYVSDNTNHGVNTSSNLNIKHKESSLKSDCSVNTRINIDEQPVDMNVDNDLEDGQILTDGSLSDVGSVRTVASDAVDMDCKTSDINMVITIPGNSCEFRKNVRSSTREYRHRQRSSSRSSVTSSTSCDTKSISSQSMKGSESYKHDGYSDSSKRKHHHSEQQNQTGRRRHQTAHDSGYQHISIQSDVTHTMKRHHSLEEVVRKRHKSGDILEDNVNNEASIGCSGTLSKHNNDIELTDSRYPVETTTKQNYNQPSVHDDSDQPSIHDRLGWKSINQSLQSIPKTVPEQLNYQSKHFQTVQSKTYGNLGQENMQKIKNSGHHKVHDRLGQLYIHEQSGIRSIKRQEVKPVKHHHEIYGSYNTSKTSSTIVDEDILKEGHIKYENMKRNSDSSNPAGKNSGGKRRKSLEEQEKEMENDKKFLEEFKMKIIGKK